MSQLSFSQFLTTSLGIIPHSARPPSRNFTGARLSFAVKLSTNEWTGRIKAAQEELRHFTGALAMLHIIKHQFLDGNDGDRQGMPQSSEFWGQNIKYKDFRIVKTIYLKMSFETQSAYQNVHRR